MKHTGDYEMHWGQLASLSFIRITAASPRDLAHLSNSLTCSAATSGVFPQTPTSVQDTLFSVCSHW